MSLPQMDPRGTGAQTHLEYHGPENAGPTDLDTVFWQGDVDPKTHARGPLELTAYPDCYGGTCDDTLVVDAAWAHNANTHWIRESSNRHTASRHRGALKDHAAVTRVKRLIDYGGTVGDSRIYADTGCGYSFPFLSYTGETKWSSKYPAVTFIPTSKMIDKEPKWTTRCIKNSTRGHKGFPATKNYGELPMYTQMIYDGTLVGKNETLQPTPWGPGNFKLDVDYFERNRSDRRFDCEGWCR